MEATEKEILERVEGLRRRRFWGKLTLCFKSGELYNFTQEETIKPKNGGANGNDKQKD